MVRNEEFDKLIQEKTNLLMELKEAENREEQLKQRVKDLENTVEIRQRELEESAMR